jgi:hypothetical protein
MRKVISREDADAQGLLRYFTGEPCVLGGIGERLVKSTKCQCEAHLAIVKDQKAASYQRNKSAIAPRRKAYRAENKEAIAARKRAEYSANRDAYAARNKRNREAPGNREKAMEYARQYYQDNRERLDEANQRWETENADRYKSIRAKHSAIRRAAELRAVPFWYGEFDAFVEEEAHHLRILRNEATGIEWHVDHMVPLRCKVASGLHCASNFQVIPAGPNISKSNKLILSEPGEWIMATLQ